MLIFQDESYARVCAEAQPLARAHWDEVEAPLHGARDYTLDAERYRLLENLGMLHIVAARCSGEAGSPLAGYAAFALCPCPHRPGVLLAALDGLYLAPAWRKGFSALSLLRYAEKRLALRGVGLVQYSSPASRPCDALYRRLGAAHTETLWHKEL